MGGIVAIVSFNVTLDCDVETNASANVFINNDGRVTLRNSSIEPWSSPSGPLPVSQPPPANTNLPFPVCQQGVYVVSVLLLLCVCLNALLDTMFLHRPFCRIYTEDVVCCREQGLVTPRRYASIFLVCSEFTIVPDARCFTVTGPPNATVCWSRANMVNTVMFCFVLFLFCSSLLFNCLMPFTQVVSTDFGTYLEGRRYLVNWANSTDYMGPINIGLNQYVLGYVFATT